ncbi:Pentatricopeptide repeat-containing protein [Rhynchospora pubera]|uniref:Pentatricopeptide repeat-containing protein n=1 Tax=Rhynchospora pubera TaxID=906938 RepID=A0AAV8FQY3_9POAL|nr:Pentatricopeptide repeat-containing protein [Rhynchospora pubera]
MAEPATIPLESHLRLTTRQFRLFGPTSSILSKSHRKIPRALSVTLQSKPPDLKSKQKSSVPVSLRHPNQHSRLEISDDSTEATVSSSSSSNGSNNLPSHVLRLMDALHMPLNEEQYLSLIKECTDMRDAAQAAIVHAHILSSHGDPLPLLLVNRLMLMYAASGDIENAGKLFDEMPAKDSLSWAILISAYSELPDGHYKALKLFAKMFSQPNEGEYFLHAIVSALRSCARSRNLGFGLQIHALIIKQVGLPEALARNLGNALVQFYCRVDCLDIALQVFDEMKRFHLETIGLSAWSGTITSCNQDGRFEEAILLFIQMALSGKRRDSKSLSSALTASAKVGNHGLPGKQIHADAIKHGLVSEPYVVASLVHMYSKQGLLTEAMRSFEAIERPDVVCWNAMLKKEHSQLLAVFVSTYSSCIRFPSSTNGLLWQSNTKKWY